MTYPSKIILHCPLVDATRLEPFVEACLADGVALVAVVGPGAQQVEDLIDEIIVGDGADPRRFMLTTAHPTESIEAVLDLISHWDVGRDDEVEQVRL